jgi:superfamily II DNA/RNA helicase
MPSNFTWDTHEGRKTLNALVKRLVPAWKDGLHQSQDDVICQILDGKEVVYCTATGGGKSAAFMVPILVRQYLYGRENVLPGVWKKKVRQYPVGLVVMPTKGLAGNIVRS